MPWKFDRKLAPRFCERFNRVLTAFSGLAVAPLLGARHVVKAEKSA